MARSIIYAEAEEPEWLKGRPALKVGDWVQVDWRHGLSIDSWSGDVSDLYQPSYLVATYGSDFTEISAIYGIVKRRRDRDWLQQAMMAKPDSQYKSVEHIGRIHLVIPRREYVRPGGYYVEIFSGDDAISVRFRQKILNMLRFFKII